jgi:uncharacterized damage-inducible protein DinB
MNAKDAIRQQIEFSHMLTGMYVADLTDAELLVRPLPGVNHIAWQLGHMIGGTQHMLGALGHAMELPAGFAEGYTKETAGCDDAARFATKAQYLELLERVKAASLAAVDATPDAALDQPGPEAMRAYAPTVAAVLMLLGQHLVMHAGQFVVVRRKLGKPPLF